MNKQQGINFLKEFNLNTIQLLSFNDLYNNPDLIKQGLSLRLSSYNDNIDVNLPSIHNVTSINEVINFYEKYHNKFNVLIHKTINPQIIGSISKYPIGDYNVIVIETFKDFNKRKEENVFERAGIILIDNRIIKTDYNNFKNKTLLKEILDNVKDIHYSTFDLEFVYDKELIFTDFYSTSFGKKLIKK